MSVHETDSSPAFVMRRLASLVYMFRRIDIMPGSCQKKRVAKENYRQL